ncbi:MAG: HEAT repeat domain-containing protein [Sandaracinaceae bacterium]|nr:HEAT repeat domain-containing protein [Sandaracinaceae bacterium]
MTNQTRKNKTRAQGFYSAFLLCIFALASTGVGMSHAQDRQAMVRLLNSNSDFRLRVQAAFAISAVHDESMVQPLVRALRDPNPAVRAAAATSLGRLGFPSALSALRAANRDASAAVRMQVERSIRAITTATPGQMQMGPPQVVSARIVPDPLTMMPAATPTIVWSQVRYVVLLGDMQNRSGYDGDALAVQLRSEVEQNLRRVTNIVALNAVDSNAEREIRRRRIARFRLDGSLARVERNVISRELAVRCEVRLMLLDDPSRNMRGALNGAATGVDLLSGARLQQERRLARQALAGAVHSALSAAPQAFARATR